MAKIVMNKINELYKGHYELFIDWQSPSILHRILDMSYKYIWGVEHIENSVLWDNYYHSLYGVNVKDYSVKARNISMEYLLELPVFMSLIPNIRRTINIIQTNIIPPNYLVLSRLKGKRKYDLMTSKIEYLCEIIIPGIAYYVQIISPNIDFIENVLRVLNFPPPYDSN